MNRHVPPVLFGVNDEELADELDRIAVSERHEVAGPVTIIAGVRHALTDEALPVLIVRCDDDHIHYVAFPGGTVT